MSKMSVLDQGWIDLVFEGRNQSYGAYQLRKQDARTTMLALFAGIASMGLFVSIPLLINYFANKVPAPVEDLVPELPPTIVEAKLHKIEPPKPLPVEPAGGTPITEPTVKFVAPVAAANPVTTEVPTTIQVQTTTISTITTPGTTVGPSFGTQPPGTTQGTGTGNGPGTDEGPIDSHFVDVAPLYPGGLNKFYEDVQKRFNVPEMDSQQTIRVFVSFVVEKDGTLSNIKALNKPGHNLDKEAERVLRSLKKKWTPGQKNGQNVRTTYKLPIMIDVH